MKNQPLLSVIIPVYNSGRHLYRCLDSVTGQTYKNLQIILIDDGSTDGSPAVCDEYAARDERIIVRHTPNGGVSAARNHGLSLSTGDYIHFPDSDDYLDSDAYEYLIDLIQRQQADIVCFEYYVTCPDREKQHLLTKEHYGLKNRDEAMQEQVTGTPFCWTKLYNAKLLNGLSFRVGLARGEDGEFARLAIDRAQRIFFDSRPLLHYVQSEDSAVRGAFRRSQLSILDFLGQWQDFFCERYPKLLPRYVANNLHLIISLYCDMYQDRADWKAEMKNAFGQYKKMHQSKGNSGQWRRKERMKFRLFRFSPRLFCVVHGIIHKEK